MHSVKIIEGWSLKPIPDSLLLLLLLLHQLVMQCSILCYLVIKRMDAWMEVFLFCCFLQSLFHYAFLIASHLFLTSYHTYSHLHLLLPMLPALSPFPEDSILKRCPQDEAILFAFRSSQRHTLTSPSPTRTWSRNQVIRGTAATAANDTKHSRGNSRYSVLPFNHLDAILNLFTFTFNRQPICDAWFGRRVTLYNRADQKSTQNAALTSVFDHAW